MSQPSTAAQNGDVILRTERLTKAFRGFVAVNDVSLDVRSGTIHALIGPNGAGKTTLFNLVTKFLDPTAGRIFFKDQDITALKPAEVARLGMVRSFQISAVFPNLTVLENVRIALQRFRPTDFSSGARSAACMNWTSEPKRCSPRSASMAMRSRRRSSCLRPPPRARSGDDACARSGAAPARRADVRHGARRHWAHRRIDPRVAANRTVVMVEHNLSVVADLSDRITVLARGEILADGTL